MENEKLKEVSDIARNQIELLETRKLAESTELESLRSEVTDLQTASDEKALVGRLHRQIIAMQMREIDFAQREKASQGKVARLEAQLFRLNKRADDKEEQAMHARARSYVKLRTLFKVIQDLRHQYSGSIPLSRQEKLSQTILELNEEKRRTNQLLKEAEKKALEAEIKAEEMIIKQEGVEQLLASLKQGARTKQVRDHISIFSNVRNRNYYSPQGS